MRDLLEDLARRAAEQAADDAEAFVRSVNEFLMSKSWPQAQRALELHPEVVSDATERMLSACANDAVREGNNGTARYLDERRRLLSRCRQVGVQQAFREKSAPAVNTGPTGVIVGAGGDPIGLGLACFALGATTLGMVLIGVVPLTAVAIAVPIIAAATGFFQVISVVWAVLIGQSFVAVVLGLFSGFWLSLTMLVLGLGHDWYGGPTVFTPDVVTHSEALFFIAGATMFFFLLIPSLRLPAVYPLIVAVVDLALIVMTLAIWNASLEAFKLTGWLVLLGAALGSWGFLNSTWVSLAGRASPRSGPLPSAHLADSPYGLSRMERSEECTFAEHQWEPASSRNPKYMAVELRCRRCGAGHRSELLVTPTGKVRSTVLIFPARGEPEGHVSPEVVAWSLMTCERSVCDFEQREGVSVIRGTPFIGVPYTPMAENSSGRDDDG